MNLPECDFQILKLSHLFYKTYTQAEYKEIMLKQGRAYHFRYSKRAEKHKSGLDYSKIVIINDSNYLEFKGALIDDDEFSETMKNLECTNSRLSVIKNYLICVNFFKLYPIYIKEDRKTLKFNTK